MGMLLGKAATYPQVCLSGNPALNVGSVYQIVSFNAPAAIQMLYLAGGNQGTRVNAVGTDPLNNLGGGACDFYVTIANFQGSNNVTTAAFQTVCVVDQTGATREYQMSAISGSFIGATSTFYFGTGSSPVWTSASSNKIITIT